MKADTGTDWLPPRPDRDDGQPRRVGVEIELAELTPDVMTAVIAAVFGGTVEQQSPLDWRVVDTALGDFGVELDWDDLKSLAGKHAPPEKRDRDDEGFSRTLVKLAARAAEQLIPWEIVTPPIAIASLPQLCPLVDRLRQRGARGTRNAPHYAFGVHLNPELPDLKAETIAGYLKAFMCLYDWIALQERTDLTRKATNYINHFDSHYIAKVVDPDYWPSQSDLIDDYLRDNPTRNRSLDLLPLFAHLDEPRVRRAVRDPRVNARPTFHYRLPNCDIDNPDWNLDTPWRLWLEVEKLAADRPRLLAVCREYREELFRLTHRFESRWEQRVEELLRQQAQGSRSTDRK